MRVAEAPQGVHFRGGQGPEAARPQARIRFSFDTG
jgi:hypothetical protein